MHVKNVFFRKRLKNIKKGATPGGSDLKGWPSAAVPDRACHRVADTHAKGPAHPGGMRRTFAAVVI